MTFRSSSAISENSIVFFEGGHDHDGVSSSLIDTEQYSIYDFIVGKTGSNARQIRQQRNFDNLKTVVSNIVINDVLGPSGIRLLPNSVQSVHIAAGAITANELAANIVLVNNVISSNNYVPNTSGWVLYSNGTAEFGAASIRGTLTAGAVVINNNNYWYSNGVFRVGSNSEFMSFNGSDLSVTGDVTTGNLTATGGTIGDLEISGGAVEYNDSGTSSYLRLGPQTFPTNDGSAALVVSSSYSGGSYSRMLPSEVRTTGSMYATGFVGEFGRMDDYRNSSGGNATFYGTLVGNADTASLATTALNSDRLDGYYLSSSDVANTVPIRRSDTSIQASYFVMTGGVTGSGSTIIKRSDGYILVQSSKRALKTNIENINNSLDIIDLLQPRKFNWIPQADDPDDIFHKQIKYVHKTYGFVVEEVSDVSPELLEYSIANNELDAHYWKPHDFIALCVQGIKDLKSVIFGLQTTVSGLEQRIQQLENGV